MPSSAPRLQPLPAVDDHILADGTRHEILDGKLFPVPPSQEPHASLNSKLAALLEAHVAADFNAAVDMLTRTHHLDEFAPDASVYPAARDPDTGGRQLEHLAFEVVSTESLGHAATKAAKLHERGVRRIFALDVEGQRVLEWSPSKGAWKSLKEGTRIEDHCLAVPLPVDAIARAVKTDDAVAAALLAKGNAILQQAISRSRQEGMRQGEHKGKVEEARRAVLRVLSRRGLVLTPEQQAQVEACGDLATLERWLDQAITAPSADEALRLSWSHPPVEIPPVGGNRRRERSPVHGWDRGAHGDQLLGRSGVDPDGGI
jgi:Uma2 family endonuclease